MDNQLTDAIRNRIASIKKLVDKVNDSESQYSLFS